jgi:CBS domain-containing membrane protein
MKSMKVGALMSQHVITLESDHSIHLAGSLMNLKHVRHLPVVDGGRLVGLITHRDLIRAQADLMARHYDPAEKTRTFSIPVSEVMKSNVWTVTPHTPVLEAAQIMLDHKYGCLPVVEDGRLVGIVTESDFLALVIRALGSRREREDTDPKLRQ